MVDWINNKPESKLFECDACESVFTDDPGATCPVCGEPLGDTADPQAVAHLEAAYEERTEYEGA